MLGIPVAPALRQNCSDSYQFLLTKTQVDPLSREPGVAVETRLPERPSGAVAPKCRSYLLSKFVSRGLQVSVCIALR